MEQESVSSIPRNNSPAMDLSNIVAVVINISSLISFSGNSKKREHPGFMDTEEADNASTPKKKKIGQEGQLVPVYKSSVKGKQKQDKSKLTGLELQEYVFYGVTPNKYISKEEWLNTYRGVADKTFDETTKLYEEVRQLPQPDVTLKTVLDHAKDILSLSMTIGNKVSEVNVNLENIPTTYIINFHRETNDIIYIRLLKYTLQVSKMESSKKKAQDLLRIEKVENKAL